MSSKRKKTGAQKTARGKARPRQRRTSVGTYALIVGGVLLAVGVVAVLVLLDRGQNSAGDPGSEASLDKSLGAPEAAVVVLEFADFQCPYCREFAAGSGQQLKEEYVDTGQARFVFRHFAFIGEESVWAAEASECANEQGRFWDYHDKLFEEQGAENSGAFAPENLKRFAAELELDTAEFNTCLDSGEYRDKVIAENTEAQRRRVAGTPTLLVNEKVVPNGAVYQVLRTAIEAALSAE